MKSLTIAFLLIAFCALGLCRPDCPKPCNDMYLPICVETADGGVRQFRNGCQLRAYTCREENEEYNKVVRCPAYLLPGIGQGL